MQSVSARAEGIIRQGFCITWKPITGYDSPVTFNWSTVWELALLVAGAAALWLFMAMGWHRLHRAPRRRQVFSPLVGGALLIAMIMAAQVGAMIAASAFQITQTSSGTETALTLRELSQVMLGAYAAQAIVLMAYLHLLMQARRPLNDHRLKPLSALAVGIGGLALFWPMLTAVGWIVRRTVEVVQDAPVDPIAHDTLALILQSDHTVWWALLVAMVILAAPVVEEVLYRGILQETLGELGMGHWTAVAITSAIFTLMHVTVVPLWALPSLFVLSLGFGWAYEKTGRLAAPIAMHVLFNAGNLLLGAATS